MKRSIFYTCLAALLMVSCDSTEVTKSSLLEYRNNGAYASSKGFAVKYTAYKNTTVKANIWHIYETGSDAINIWVPDTTLTKNTFEIPSFKAVLKTSAAKTYQASSGQFRLLGMEANDLSGDFHFRMKNISDPNDSITISEGYFRIYLDYKDSTLVK